VKRFTCYYDECFGSSNVNAKRMIHSPDNCLTSGLQYGAFRSLVQMRRI